MTCCTVPLQHSEKEGANKDNQLGFCSALVKQSCRTSLKRQTTWELHLFLIQRIIFLHKLKRFGFNSLYNIVKGFRVNIPWYICEFGCGHSYSTWAAPVQFNVFLQYRSADRLRRTAAGWRREPQTATFLRDAVTSRFPGLFHCLQLDTHSTCMKKIYELWSGAIWGYIERQLCILSPKGLNI